MNRIAQALIVLAALGSAAEAQPSTDAAAQAEQAYQRGRSHYDLREWDRAIAEFKEAYRLRSDAASLFNIAQSYRLKGDCVQAASFYKTYRRNFPGEKNIPRVEEFIVEMDACASKQEATTSTPVGTPPEATTEPTSEGTPTSPATSATPDAAGRGPMPPVAAAESAPAAGRALTVAGIAVGATGGACVVAGVLFALRARSIEDEITQQVRWDPGLHDRGQNADLAAKVLFAVGGAAVVTGATLLWLGHRKTDAASSSLAQLRVVPHAHGASVGWSTTF